MQKLMLFYLAAFIFVVFLIVFFLFNSGLLGSKFQGASEEEEPQKHEFDWDNLISENNSLLPKNLYAALDKGDVSFCESESGIDSGICSEIFLYSQVHCQKGKSTEKIFCSAFLSNRTDYCEWVFPKWYAVSCRAIIEKNPVLCMKIISIQERARCICDLALNIDGLDCFLLDPDWALLCVAQQESNKEKCEAINEDEIKVGCLSLFTL